VTSACGRSVEPFGGRVISGLDEMWPSRWVRGDQDAALAVVEDGVGGAVAGAVVHVERPVAKAHLVAVVQHARDIGAGAPGAKRLRHRAQRAHHVLRDAVAEHHGPSELVVLLRLLRVVLDERNRHVDCRHLRAGALRHERDQAEMVDVLVGEDHELDVLEPMAELCQAARERVEGGGGIGACVDEGERLVVDQVDVHPPDRERCRDRDAVDSVAHARISSSTSSRFSSMCSRETTDSRFSRSSGSVFDGRTLKCQSS
jgi:hypothetical protein